MFSNMPKQAARACDILLVIGLFEMIWFSLLTYTVIQDRFSDLLVVAMWLLMMFLCVGPLLGCWLLYKRFAFGKVLAWIYFSIFLIGFPIGTIISIVGIRALQSDEMKQHFGEAVPGASQGDYYA